MWWNDHGMTWDARPAMVVLMAVLAVVATVLVMLVIRSTEVDRTPSEARRILDARLAKGEIDPDEYEVRREALSRTEQ